MRPRIVSLVLAVTVAAAGQAAVVTRAPRHAQARPVTQAAAAPTRSGAGPRVLVAYLSKSGHTETMARAVADGARSVAGGVVTLRTIGEVKDDDLLGGGVWRVGDHRGGQGQ